MQTEEERIEELIYEINNMPIRDIEDFEELSLMIGELTDYGPGLAGDIDDIVSNIHRPLKKVLRKISDAEEAIRFFRIVQRFQNYLGLPDNYLTREIL